jgi:hypothetical protein
VNRIASECTQLAPTRPPPAPSAAWRAGARGPRWRDDPRHAAFAPRGQIQLGREIRGDVPEIGLRKGELLPLPKIKGHGAKPATAPTKP